MAEIVGDWELDLLEPLAANMQRTADAIVRHDLIENAGVVAAEVREALALLDAWRNADYSGTSTDEYIERDNAAWWAFWNYLGGHIRGWWD